MLKEKVLDAIAKAQTELQQALADLEQLPVIDPGAVNFAAHALKNFLTVTDGTCQLLLAALAERPDPQVHIWVEGLQRASYMMSNILNGLTPQGKSGTDLLLKFEKVDLPLLVRRCCAYAQNLAELKNLQIIFESRADWPYVRTDRIVVAVVLDNLLSNAIKYSPPGRNIRVEVKGVPGFLVCTVRDEGQGLSPEDQARLFQEGGPLGSEPTGGESSLGYGLLVVKSLLDNIQTEIWCDSEAGRGASFSFRLPRWRD